MGIVRTVLATLALVVAFAGPVGAAVGPTGEVASRTYFSVDDLVNGTSMTQSQCDALATAVWVTADNSSECLRYYMSAPQGRDDAVVLLHGDFVNADNGGTPRVTAADYARTGPQDELNDAAALAQNFGRTAIVLARPGTFGSSGNELKIRHTVHEARLVDAALSLIAARHGIRRFHLVGQSGGAILIGALLASRSDIGCASLGAGRLAVTAEDAARDLAEEAPQTLLDDQAYMAGVRGAADLRTFVISDPADIRSSIAGQNLFVARARARGIPVTHLLTVANFDRGAHHDVMGQALRVLYECLDGASDERIAAVVQQFGRENARKWAQQAPSPRLRQAAMRSSSASTSARSPSAK